jgi:hypothetical protein
MRRAQRRGRRLEGDHYSRSAPKEQKLIDAPKNARIAHTWRTANDVA